MKRFLVRHPDYYKTTGYREQSRLRSQRNRDAHPDAQRLLEKNFRVRNSTKLQAYRYIRTHGERIENKVARIEAQGGKCANRACGVPVDIRTGHQDHDHETGEMRGVLCQKCNQALGLLQDNAATVDGLSEYRKTFL